MNFLIAGLGNIGPDYQHTRHNIGFDILDRLAERHKFIYETERLAMVGMFRLKGKNVYCIKPTTYMNLSGKAVKYWLSQLKIDNAQLLVVIDDLALPFGTIRLRSKGSPGGHNGLKDIDLSLQTQAYSRLRFGIGNQFAQGKQVNYVLGKWKDDEQQALSGHKDRAADCIESFVLEGIERAMTKWNAAP